MTSQVTAPKFIGARIQRREDPRLITGSGRYVDDIRLLDMHYLALVRSPHGHARIRAIDTSEVATMPGVVAVWTHQDVKHLGPLPVVGVLPGMQKPARYPLARDKVRHVGDPVVAIVATDRYSARDAALAVRVDYEALPAVMDVEQAEKPGATLIHEDLGSNVAAAVTRTLGEPDRAFAAADRIVQVRIMNQRVMPFPLEPRGSVASWDAPKTHLTLWNSTQVPHVLRAHLAPVFGLKESQLRVVAPDVGGGFGAKADINPDDVLTAYAAGAIGKPVKFIEERSENFLAAGQGRGQTDYVEAAVKADGTLLGLRIKILADVGGYLPFLSGIVPLSTVALAAGVYRVQHIEIELHLVYTNKAPTSAYRGAGRPEATFMLERTMDVVASELGLDPVEVRRKNLIEPHRFPYTTPTGATYDSGDYQAALNKALEVLDYDAFRAEQAKARTQGRHLGLGFSIYTEACGSGPSARLGIFGGGWESATVRVERSGRVTVLTGTSPHGQGIETAFAQMVADGLGVAPEEVEVVHGDTDRVQEGMGTFGSRSIAVGGSALHQAIVKVREKAQRIAAVMLEANPVDLVFDEGRYLVRGTPGKALTLAEIARKAYVPVGLPRDIEPGLEAGSYFEPLNQTFPFGVHCAVVEVDADTGKVALRRYLAVDDCGTVINPMLRDGQILGGIVQGAGQALLEEVLYDENGQLLSGSLMDYAAPRADDFPAFELHQTVTPTPINPLGAKGVGEAGTIGSTPAVANAVLDALHPFGVRHLDMPMAPEKVWRAIQGSGR